ncbi:hypothetical protein [Acetobacter cerevisiae]|uniref:hypothetical protein n=1 Tax=Acetobacter cerevisiae TaxID=178900 RepID=UPI000AA736DC|nr:hypothetical protein [Acetobacter cerevisiae]
MTDTPKANSTEKTETTADPVGNNVCGIVMPIASMSEDYPAEHWMRVRKILEKAIIDSGFSPKVVWDNPDVSIIQSKILKNIYDNEVIICDLSNLNSNVMLEAGLRLSTKKPTILVTDGVKKPPFDIASIEYLPYPKNLEYNQIDLFIKELSERISSESKSYRSGTYKSFVDSYQFEIAKPSTIEISAEQYFAQQIDELKSLIVSNMQTKDCNSENIDTNKNEKNKILRFIVNLALQDFKDIMAEYDLSDYVISIKCKPANDGFYYYYIKLDGKLGDDIYLALKTILRRNGAKFI